MLIILTLILLSLVGDSIAVDCTTSPPTVNYAILGNFALTDGTIVEYYCPPHWVFDTTLKRTGVTSTCTNGVWSSPSAKCIRMGPPS